MARETKVTVVFLVLPVIKLINKVVLGNDLNFVFPQGRTLARDSEISERDMVPRELMVPEVHGRGANDD